MVPEKGISVVAIAVGATLLLLGARAVASELVSLDGTSASREQIAGQLFRRSTHLTHAAAILSLDEAGDAQSDADLDAVLTEALSRAPSSPYNWARLAALRWKQGRFAEAADALQESVGTGAAAPNLAAPRAAMGFALVRLGVQRVAALTDSQIRLAAQVDARGLARFARDAVFADHCRAVLANDPARLRALKRAQERLAAGLP